MLRMRIECYCEPEAFGTIYLLYLLFSDGTVLVQKGQFNVFHCLHDQERSVLRKDNSLVHL